MASQLTTIEARILSLLSLWGWETRINDMDGDIQIRTGPNAEWEYITRTLECYFRTEARTAGITEVNAAWDAVIASGRKHHYHPVRDYLNGLSYDGGQYIKSLAECFVNPDNMLETFLRRWLIGAVRRVVEGGTQNRMLVLDGPQGIGKSKFVEWLIPKSLRRSHFRASPIDPSNEDHRRWLLKTWIWEVSELGATTRRADMEALKGFLSLEQVAIRLKYDRGDTEKPSMASFIGTINNILGVLNDPTGSRRFMFCTVTDIDWQQYTTTLTPDQVWAEAYAAYLMGEPADLSPTEAAAATAINDGYQVENPVQDLILHYYKIDPTDTTVNFTWTADIEHLLQNPAAVQTANGNFVPDRSYKGDQRKLRYEISSVLFQMGCKKADRRKQGSTSPQKGFWGVAKK